MNALHLDVDPVPPRSENLTGYGLALKRDVIRRFDAASEPLDQEMVKLHSLDLDDHELGAVSRHGRRVARCRGRSS